MKETILSSLTSNTCCRVLKVMLLLFFHFLSLPPIMLTHRALEKLDFESLPPLFSSLEVSHPSYSKLVNSHSPSLLSLLSTSTSCPHRRKHVLCMTH